MNDDPSAPSAAAPAPTVGFACGACGGRMEYDPGRSCLVCVFCAATRAVGAGDVERTIVEYDLEHGRAATAPHGYGAAVRSLACTQCGARVSQGENATAGSCPFCGSPRVLEQAQHRHPIRPESVLPFQIDGARAREGFSAWLRALWFRPSDLQKLAAISEITGMYVPYWAFDARVRSSWTAEAGYYYYVTETYAARDAQGNTVQRERQVRRVRWEPAWGNRHDSYDDFLECGSKGLPRALTQKLEPFDTARLVPYEPGFLAGFRAEEYSIDLNSAWESAIRRIERLQRQRCSGDVPGDTQRHLHVTHRFENEKFKHILLPIWMAVYRYRGKPYQFLINGQTGEVSGHAPYSALKIALFSLLLLALALALFALSR